MTARYFNWCRLSGVTVTLALLVLAPQTRTAETLQGGHDSDTEMYDDSGVQPILNNHIRDTHSGHRNSHIRTANIHDKVNDVHNVNSDDDTKDRDSPETIGQLGREYQANQYVVTDDQTNFNDNIRRLQQEQSHDIIAGRDDLPAGSVLTPRDEGYLPSEGVVQHYTRTANHWPGQYGHNMPFDTMLKLEAVLRAKRSLRRKKTNMNGMEQIVIASLLPKNDSKLFSIKKVRPAIELAIERMNPLLAAHNRSLVVKFRDSKCDIAEGMNELINFYIHDEIDVLLGPCCDYAIAPCARQVPFWNIPLLTAGGIAADFGTFKNSTFYTMTRLGPNFRQLTSMLVKMLAFHRWRKIRLIYEPTGERNVSNKHCYLATNDIHYGIMFSEEAASVKQDYKKFERREEILNNMPEFFTLDVANASDVLADMHRRIGTVAGIVTAASEAGRSRVYSVTKSPDRRALRDAMLKLPPEQLTWQQLDDQTADGCHQDHHGTTAQAVGRRATSPVDVQSQESYLDKKTYEDTTIVSFSNFGVPRAGVDCFGPPPVPGIGDVSPASSLDDIQNNESYLDYKQVEDTTIVSFSNFGVPRADVDYFGPPPVPVIGEVSPASPLDDIQNNESYLDYKPFDDTTIVSFSNFGVPRAGVDCFGPPPVPGIGDVSPASSLDDIQNNESYLDYKQVEDTTIVSFSNFGVPRADVDYFGPPPVPVIGEVSPASPLDDIQNNESYLDYKPFDDTTIVSFSNFGVPRADVDCFGPPSVPSTGDVSPASSFDDMLNKESCLDYKTFEDTTIVSFGNFDFGPPPVPVDDGVSPADEDCFGPPPVPVVDGVSTADVDCFGPPPVPVVDGVSPADVDCSGPLPVPVVDGDSPADVDCSGPPTVPIVDGVSPADVDCSGPPLVPVIDGVSTADADCSGPPTVPVVDGVSPADVDCFAPLPNANDVCCLSPDSVSTSGTYAHDSVCDVVIDDEDDEMDGIMGIFSRGH